jgi:hypothetical protein
MGTGTSLESRAEKESVSNPASHCERPNVASPSADYTTHNRTATSTERPSSNPNGYLGALPKLLN